jgi:sterol desaturase/sphingolipid hydroxylase (fatty acid hydroxylase superfamily)
MWDIFGLKYLVLAFLVFAPLEHLFATHAEKKILRQAWKLDLFYAVFSAMLTKAGLTAIVIGTSYFAALWIPSSFKTDVGALPLWIQVAVAILLSDLGFYGVHRLFHKIPFLWKFHAVHHSIETMDWLAGHRVHPLDQIFTKGASLVPVFALGFSDTTVAIYGAIYFWQSMLIHSNVNLRLGPLRYILALPQFHHWHHADHPEAHDRNFAGQLAFLDFIFRTHHLPEQAVPERYGTSTPVPSDYLGQIVFPFKSVHSDAAAAELSPVSAKAEPGQATTLSGRLDDQRTLDWANMGV